MNDLPQNELFSAYLDGELTAAEQAEMERLLATSPAARQLLEELRTLSNTLQALPQEKLGEDISPHVLRVAERRMLTEGRLDEESAAVPLGRSLRERFVNRRTIFWLSLTAAIAVIITIHDRRQQVQLPDGGGRELARRQSDEVSAARGPGVQPSIQAAPGSEDGRRTEVKALLKEETSKPLSKVALEPAPEQKPELRAAKAPAEQPADQSGPLTVKVTGKEAPTTAAPVATYGASSAPSAPLPSRSPAPASAGQIAGPSSVTLPQSGEELRRDEIGFGVARSDKSSGSDLDTLHKRIVRDGQSDKLGEGNQGVLVVRCDVSPEAANKRSLVKLLDANGIAWQQPARPRVLVEEAEEKASEESLKRKADESVEVGAKAIPASEDQHVYVEATPAQVEAVLAGLRAQPDVFLAVSVGPGNQRLGGSPELADHIEYFDRGSQDQKSAGVKLFGGQSAARTSPADQAREAAPAAKPSLAYTENKPAKSASATIERRLNNARPQAESAPEPPRQRVLFILHTVAGKVEAAKSEKKDAAPPAKMPAP